MSRQTTALLAEDDYIWLTIFKEALEDNGFETICVRDAAGVEAEWRNADVLVIDAMLGEPLPEHLGVGAVGKLLKQGLIPERVPVVFVSSNALSDSEYKLHELEIPVERYVWLQKPVEEEFLIQVIDDELEKRAGLG